MNAKIVDASAISYDEWLSMWASYVGGQFEHMECAVHQGIFARLRDSSSQLQGLVAVAEVPIGFAHFYLHPSTYSLASACTLDDLYVAPAARRQGIARKLIQAVAAQAHSAGAYVLHWKTHETNAAAIKLYETITSRTNYVSYRLELKHEQDAA
jgi:GNAT superfamily N-acetyltransferase